MIDFTNLGWGMLIVGILGFIAVLAVRNKNGVHKDVKWVIGLLAVALILAPIFVTSLQAPTTAQVATTGNPPTVSFTHLSTGVTYVSASNTFTVKATLNATGVLTAPASGKISFDASIVSLSTVATFPQVQLSANPAISNTTATTNSANYNSYLFTKYSNNTMDVQVQTPTSTYTDVSNTGAAYPVQLAAAGNAQVNFTFALSTQGIQNLNGNANGGVGTLDYNFQIAGQTYTIDVIVVS